MTEITGDIQTASTRVIATHVLRLDPPQTATFTGRESEAAILCHISTRHSPELDAAGMLHPKAKRVGCHGVADIIRRQPDAHKQHPDVMELTFAGYSLFPLQVVKGRSLPIPWDIIWGERVNLAQLQRPEGRQVRLHPGAADPRVRPEPLIRTLIETHWTSMAATLIGTGVATRSGSASDHGHAVSVVPSTCRPWLNRCEGHRTAISTGDVCVSAAL